MLEKWLTDKWYQKSLSFWLWPLVPFSWLFYLMQQIRRAAFKNVLKTYRSTLPIIVVGNITLGGTGKTPFVIWLATWLTQQGYQIGIISRGVGGRATHPIVVTALSRVEDVGDEALLLALHTEATVVVCKDRVAACQKIEELGKCNMIISDDGLQHYRLERDLEIVLVDAMRQFGNQQLLPAGPLREPISRLEEAHIIVENGAKCNNIKLGAFAANYEPHCFVSVKNQKITKPLDFFKTKKVHAIAGIGHPQQFFTMLQNLGLVTIPHQFPDHYPFQPHDLLFQDNLPIVMTEKDAVKCIGFATENMWYLACELQCSADLIDALEITLVRLSHKVNCGVMRI